MVRKTRRSQRGGGEWWRFLIEKPGEIPDQLKLFFRSFEKGHNLTTYASIGNWIHKYGKAPRTQLVPLRKIILWHPVRGPSERSNAGAKTTRRKENMIRFFETQNTEEPIILSEAVMKNIPDMKSADAISAIMVTPLLQDIHRYVSNAIETYPAATRTAMDALLSQINKRKEILKAVATKSDTSKVSESTRKLLTPYYYTESTLPYIEDINPFYIVSSGQGRLQAIKEAIIEIGIDPDLVSVELTVYDVPRNLCSLFLLTGNEYREDGYFSDYRHILDNKIMPSAESCYKEGTKPEDILSLYREIDRDMIDDGELGFNSEKFSEGNYEENTTSGGKRKTRRNKRRN